MIINSHRFSVPDPNLSLLLSMDGADGSTSFTDLSPNAHTITASGDAQVDTSDSKFGGGSLLLDGTGDNLSVPDDSSLDLTGDYTIEFWVKFNSVSAGSLFTKGFYTTGSYSIVISGSVLYMDIETSRISSAMSTLGVTTGNWYHFAVVRSGSTNKLYIDGVEKLSVTNGNSLSNSLDLGIGLGVSGLQYLNGRIDDFRIKTEAVYTSNFTPPTSAHTP